MFDAPPYTGEWSLMLLDLSRRPKKGSLPKWCRWEPVYGKSHPTPRRLQLHTRCFADLKSLWFESFSFLVAWELGVNLIIIIPIPESTYKYQHSCVQGPLRECRLIRWGASGLPYYCIPPATVLDVLGVLSVWQHTTKKKKLGWHTECFRVVVYLW